MVYGKGSGADCRKLVQSLNMTAGELMESRRTSSNMQPNEHESTPHKEEVIRDSSEATSKWTNFLEEPEWTGFEDSNPDTKEHFNVVTERPRAIRRQHGIISFNKKQRFPEKTTHWQSSYCTKSASENVDSEKLYQQELLSLSASSSYPADVDEFDEGNDTLSSSRCRFFTRVSEDDKTSHPESEMNRCHASSKPSIEDSNLKNGVLQEKIPQQMNVSIHKQSHPMKRKRKYEAEVSKETLVNVRGNNSKWNMFLPAEMDDSEEEEKHVSEDSMERGWLKEDSTVMLDECSRSKIFQIDDALNDDLSWYD
ncbi:hypothetical protein HOLleu_40172 [Holothuria leucospilota]|uniref:MRN complex-interacting protein N-terminal domain-containing protein n=1 Tax=Holothuria leucospilota TaxID=206669 RepID=A0A9Q1BCM4_HOLLE|nr:hypothetical protein HOLleu_40172 [Holothuria leucospilota]